MRLTAQISSNCSPCGCCGCCSSRYLLFDLFRRPPSVLHLDPVQDRSLRLVCAIGLSSMGSRNDPTSWLDSFTGPGGAIDESMRLNCSMSNRGFIDGMQAVIILRFIEALCKRQSNTPSHGAREEYCPQIVESTINPDRLSGDPKIWVERHSQGLSTLCRYSVRLTSSSALAMHTLHRECLSKAYQHRYDRLTRVV